jgi:hypothetical protein
VHKYVNDAIAKLDGLVRKSMEKKQEPVFKTAAATPPATPTHNVDTNPMGL